MIGWRDISISKKLYTVVGIMAILVVVELLLLSFFMGKLSGVRAFVAGESIWSKAQKDAVIHLQRYSITKDEVDFNAFLKAFEVPEGDRKARLELMKPEPDLEVVKQGFLQGQVPEGDIPPMVDLIRKFYWISYLSEAIQAWTEGDRLLASFREAGLRYRDALLAGDRALLSKMDAEIQRLDVAVTQLENRFSFLLGEGSRWVERVVFSVLISLVLTVEGIGLTLTFLTSRALSRGLRELEGAATSIGEGDFSRKVPVRSSDEIGKVAEAVNRMGGLLDRQYRDLEERVRERTAELSKLAEENEKLYEEAKIAVQMRDEFLSIASHELKTPVTALHLELQLLNRMSHAEKGPPPEKVIELSSRASRNSKRLSALLDELLDLTRIRLGKLELNREKVDLSTIVRDVAAGFAAEVQRLGRELVMNVADGVTGNVDQLRVVQILSNLISNALKYAPSGPVEVSVSQKDGVAILSVRDHGPGVAEEQREKIFERLERGPNTPAVSGLGLGLYISRELTQAHGGQIRVEGKPGEGARFVVELPLEISSARAQGRG